MSFERKYEEKQIVRRWTIEEKPGGGFIARVLVSILGAVILVVVVRALRRA